jgi:hypothetical protein
MRSRRINHRRTATEAKTKDDHVEDVSGAKCTPANKHYFVPDETKPSDAQEKLPAEPRRMVNVTVAGVQLTVYGIYRRLQT